MQAALLAAGAASPLPQLQAAPHIGRQVRKASLQQTLTDSGISPSKNLRV
jgi:hypothetical protein